MKLRTEVVNSINDHPVCISALGMAPLVARAETLLSGTIMAVSFSVVMIFSMASVSLLRRLIHHEFRLLYLLLISSAWTTIIDMLLQSMFYDLRLGLDIYVPLIAMNSLLLMLLEGRSLRGPVSAMSGPIISTCLLVTVISVVTGSMREILAQGILLSDLGLLLPDLQLSPGAAAATPLTLPLMNSAAGAFIVLGLVMALINIILAKINSFNTDLE